MCSWLALFANISLVIEANVAGEYSHRPNLLSIRPKTESRRPRSCSKASTSKVCSCPGH